MAQFLTRLKAFGADRAPRPLRECASLGRGQGRPSPNLISQALSSPGMSVSIGAVDGVLSSDASISDIVIFRPPGPVAQGRQGLGLCGTGSLCSAGVLEVDQLTIGRLELLRRPLPSDTPPPDTGAQQPIFFPNCRSRSSSSSSACRSSRLASRWSASRLGLKHFPARATPPGRRPRASTLKPKPHKRLDAPGDFQKRSSLTFPRPIGLTLNVNSSEPAGGIFCPSRQSSPACRRSSSAFNGAGARSTIYSPRSFGLQCRRGRVWANGQVDRLRGQGRRAQANARSRLRRLEGLGSGRRSKPVFARPNDAQRRWSSSTTIQASPCPAGLHLVVGLPARLDFEGERSANGLLDFKIHAGAIFRALQRSGNWTSNASIAGTAIEPDDRRRFLTPVTIRGRAGLRRTGRGELPCEP